MHMDFSKKFMDTQGCGVYTSIEIARDRDKSILPTLYLAYNDHLSSESGQVHAPVRRLFEEGDAKIVSGMAELAALANAGVTALQNNDLDHFADL